MENMNLGIQQKIILELEEFLSGHSTALYCHVPNYVGSHQWLQDKDYIPHAVQASASFIKVYKKIGRSIIYVDAMHG